MSQLTEFQWRRQFFKIVSTTAALWGLRVRCASARPACAKAEKAAAPPLRIGNQPSAGRLWQPDASALQLTRF